MFTFKKFITFLEGEKKAGSGSKTAVFTLGRFNPPTKGHLKLINATVNEANRINGDHFIFPSQTVDIPLKRTGKVDPLRSKNPLPWDVKIHFMRQLFPHANIMQVEEIKSPHNVLDWFLDQGYTDIVFVVGSDRVQEFETRWLPYTRDTYKSAKIVSAGVRDPDAEGVSGMSGTKARQAAMEGNVAKFRASTGWSGTIATELLQAVRKGMGVD